MTRVTIILTEQEMERLHQSAKRDLRHPREQAKYILRSVLLNEREIVLTNGKSDGSQAWQGEKTGAFAGVNP